MRPIAFTTALFSALLLPTALARASGGWTWPVRGQVLTQFHNGADPYAAGQHRGVDIAAPVGTPVLAATAGTIQYAGVVGSSGVTMSQRNDDGRYVLSYLHLSSLSVGRGEHVAAGAPLGAVGVTGRRSAPQPHLHFGVRVAAHRYAYLDPLRFLAPPPADKPAPRPVPVPVRAPTPVSPAAVPVPAALRALAPAVASAAPMPARSFGPSPAHALGRVATPGAQPVPGRGAAAHAGPVPNPAAAPSLRPDALAGPSAPPSHGVDRQRAG